MRAMTTLELAELTGVSRRYVLAEIQRRKIRATKHGCQWFIDGRHAERWWESRRQSKRVIKKK